ncbi:GNVR domain-containing protein [Aureimonas sp. AU12]|uniref:GNVR domain-containing protein n=1 Tax=Aureimonas sp. AU12 TaxID=1638161 RepID=UPI0007846766|nr:GNVR domain-containing protein [Aureimonas sp. AU12]
MFYSDPLDAGRRSAPLASQTSARAEIGLFDPVHLAGAIWRAKGFVIFAALLGALLAGAYAFSTPRQFTAVSQLVIDPRDLKLVQNEVTETPNGMTTDATLALIDSQIAVMTSNSVLGRVVTQTSLTADPEFNGTRVGFLSNLNLLLGALFSSDPEAAIRNREQVTINALREHMTATRNANSFVINLAVKSEDPEKAARLANLTTEIFIAEQGRAQSEVARRATTSLSSRLAELRQRVVETEGAVEAYKAENKLVGVGGRLIDDDYITRINNQLADVRAQITSLNVRAESLRRADVDDVVGGSYPEGLNAESLLRLRQTYAEAAQNQAILATRLGPRHPQRIAAEQAMATARRAIAGELSRIVASAQTELARAQQTERDLTTQIDALRSRQIETSGAFVRLRELEREVDASRAVYEAYLLRARQTSEQESLNTANVRVISDATVPMDPSGLSRKIVVAAGGIVGLGLGVALAALAAMLGSLRRTTDSRAAADRAGLVSAAPVPRTVSIAEAAEQSAPEAFGPPRKFAIPLVDRSRDDAPETDAAGDDRSPAVEPAIVPTPVAAPIATAGWSLRGPAGDDVTEPGAPARSDEVAKVVAAADETPVSVETNRDETPTIADEAEQGGEKTAPAPATTLGDDLDARHQVLRQRIRAIGARRNIEAPPLDHGHGATAEASAPVPEGTEDPEASRERISLRIAAARGRRRAKPLLEES